MAFLRMDIFRFLVFDSVWVYCFQGVFNWVINELLRQFKVADCTIASFWWFRIDDVKLFWDVRCHIMKARWSKFRFVTLLLKFIDRIILLSNLNFLGFWSSYGIEFHGKLKFGIHFTVQKFSSKCPKNLKN